jgi:hypothetical protein
MVPPLKSPLGGCETDSESKFRSEMQKMPKLVLFTYLPNPVKQFLARVPVVVGGKNGYERLQLLEKDGLETAKIVHSRPSRGI